MIRFLTILPLVATLTAISGCAQFPELDATVPPKAENAGYPDLSPIETLLAADAYDPDAAEETTDRLDRRTRALQARADRLRRRDAQDG